MNADLTRAAEILRNEASTILKRAIRDEYRALAGRLESMSADTAVRDALDAKQVIANDATIVHAIMGDARDGGSLQPPGAELRGAVRRQFETMEKLK
jgi:hypothetical protein